MHEAANFSRSSVNLGTLEGGVGDEGDWGGREDEGGWEMREMREGGRLGR